MRSVGHLSLTTVVAVLSLQLLPMSAVAAVADSGLPSTEATSIATTFFVQNLTGGEMRFLRWVEESPSGPDTGPWFDVDGPAEPNTLFAPVTEDRFALTFWMFYTNVAILHYLFPAGAVEVRAEVGPFNGVKYSCISPSALVCSIDGNVAKVAAKSAIRHELEAPANADLIQRICDASTYLASCTFEPHGPLVETVGTRRVVGLNMHFNCRSTADTVRITWSFDEGGSHNLGTSYQVGLNLGKTIEAGITVNLGQNWSWNETFSEARDLQILPKHFAWFEHYPARLLVVGNFIVRTGNTTLILKNASFEAPKDQDLPNPSGLIVSRERLLTPEELRTYC